MSVKLTISTKELDPKINYIPFKETKTFMTEDQKEVKSSQLTNTSKIMLSASTLGAGLIPNIAYATTEINQLNESLTPQVMFQYGLKAALIGLGASFGIAMVLFICSGILKMLGGEKRKKKSRDWNTDIIKGFIQCLVAIPTIYALYYLGTTLFTQLDFSENVLLRLP